MSTPNSTTAAAANLADEINALHIEAQQHATKAVQVAVECGHKLIEARSACGHGEWMPWLTANCPHISQRQVNRYMKVAKLDVTSNLDSDTGRAQLAQIYGNPNIAPDTAPPPEPKPKVTPNPGPTRPGRVGMKFPERESQVLPRTVAKREVNKARREADAASEGLSLSAKQRLDRAVEKRLDLMQLEYTYEVNKAAEEKAPEVRIHMENRIAEADKAEEEWRRLCSHTDRLMTEADFKFIRGCLHPDKHPDAPAKYTKAYRIFNDLKDRVYWDDTRAELAKRGWDKKSSLNPHKPKPRAKRKESKS